MNLCLFNHITRTERNKVEREEKNWSENFARENSIWYYCYGCVLDGFLSVFSSSICFFLKKFPFISPAMLIFIAATLVLQRRKKNKKNRVEDFEFVAVFFCFHSFVFRLICSNLLVQFPKRQSNMLVILRIFFTFCCCCCKSFIFFSFTLIYFCTSFVY